MSRVSLETIHKLLPELAFSNFDYYTPYGLWPDLRFSILSLALILTHARLPMPLPGSALGVPFSTLQRPL